MDPSNKTTLPSNKTAAPTNASAMVALATRAVRKRPIGGFSTSSGYCRAIYFFYVSSKIYFRASSYIVINSKTSNFRFFRYKNMFIRAINFTEFTLKSIPKTCILLIIPWIGVRRLLAQDKHPRFKLASNRK